MKLQTLDDKHVMFNTKLGHYYIVACPRFFSANFHATFGGFFPRRFLDLYHFLIYIISILWKLKQEMLLQLVITTDFCVKRDLVNSQKSMKCDTSETRQKTAKNLHKEDFRHSHVVLSPIPETISYNQKYTNWWEKLVNRNAPGDIFRRLLWFSVFASAVLL